MMHQQLDLLMKVSLHGALGQLHDGIRSTILRQIVDEG
jgi:hypothetical protein